MQTVQAAPGVALRVSAMVLWLHRSRAGLNVMRQEQGGGYFSNGDERWSCETSLCLRDV